MIEIANIENSPIVQVTVNGKLTETDMKEIDDFFENKVSNLERVNVMLFMDNWEGLTMKGLLEDFKLVKHLKKMNRAAIVADSTFLQEDAKVENLFPGIQIQYFTASERDVAKKWLQE